jgi:hypothetical protein
MCHLGGRPICRDGSTHPMGVHTRPDHGLPPPTGKLSNSSRVLTIRAGVLARRRLGEIDDRSSGNDAVLDEMPQRD